MVMRMHKGFTLIELLVVIAIIAILAAILFPVFSQARAKARQATCTSNTKQISLAFMQYTQDYDEAWPRWEWGVVGGGGTPTPSAQQWYVRLYPYCKNVQAFECPSRGDNGGCLWCYANPADGRYDPNLPPFRRVHYGYNEPMSNNCCGKGKLPNLNYPAEILVLGDCFNTLGGWENNNLNLLYRYAAAARAGADCIGCGGTVPTNKMDDYAPHSAGSNIGFADGHAKWVRWQQIKETTYGGSVRYRAWNW